MMSLRLCAGLDLSDFKQRYHCDVREIYQKAIDKNVAAGLLEIVDDHLKTTAPGMYVLNEILLDFM